MFVKVKLYGILRDKLPPDAKGLAEIELPLGSTVQDIIKKLQISTMVKVSVNEALERDIQRELQEGDEVQLFRPAGGG